MILYIIVLILANFYAWPTSVVVLGWIGLIISAIFSLAGVQSRYSL